MKDQRRKIRRTTEDKVMDTVIFIIMTLILLVTLYPFYYIIIISFNDGVDALNGGIYFWPRKFTLANYQQFLSDAKWLHALWISFLKTAVGTTLTILFTCMVGYGLSAPNLMFRKFYNVVLLICMYFSGGLIPYYLILNSYGLLNTFWVYVIPTMFSTYYCILAISFFREIPTELYESARLDGAREMRIYTRIVLPLSKPLIATLGLFSAVGQWNAWSDTAFFAAGKKSLRTLAFLMRDVITKNQVDVTSKAAMMQASRYGQVTTTSVQMAAMIITILPIVLVYPFLQKHFVKGIMLGAVKG